MAIGRPDRRQRHDHGGDGLQIAISDTAKPLGRLHAHHGKVEAGTIKVGDAVALAVDTARRDATRANHSPRTCCTRRCATAWART
jgi:alanyl-tRNA synthetase